MALNWATEGFEARIQSALSIRGVYDKTSNVNGRSKYQVRHEPRAQVELGHVSLRNNANGTMHHSTAIDYEVRHRKFDSKILVDPETGCVECEDGYRATSEWSDMEQ